jgi:hypothetical protein
MTIAGHAHHCTWNTVRCGISAVYKRSVPRPHLRTTNRPFWAWLSRLWSEWQSPLAFVQPRSVIDWQRQRFGDHWRQVSQSDTPGRPPIAKEVRECLDHVIVLHDPHLIQLPTEYFQYYHDWRMHRGPTMDGPVPRPVQRPEVGSIRRVPEEGGWHHHDERRVA